jgi:hypothetical protein
VVARDVKKRARMSAEWPDKDGSVWFGYATKKREGHYQ